MAEKKSMTMLNWLLWKPLKFGLLSFCLMTLFGFLYTFLSSMIYIPQWVLPSLILFSFIIGAFYMLKHMPTENLDRHSFIALNNLQIFILSFAFIISTLIIMYNANSISYQMMMLSTHFNASFLLLMLLIGIVYMYLCGLLLSNIYAKYKRCCALGIKSWKIIASMPFGFGLLWIPGYILPEDKKQKTVLPIKCKWYDKLTHWTTKNTINTALVFTICVALSSLFFGLNMVLLTYCLAIISALWIFSIGVKKFKTLLNNKYVNFAIILNIVVLVLLIIFIMYSAVNSPETLNISINEIAML